jgi:hypothetical protein
LFAFLLPFPILAGGWLGFPPDCWSEPRFFHGENEYDPWQKNITIAVLKAEKPEPGVFSPNKGYYFVREGWRNDATITIYSEKKHLIQIKFKELFGLGETRWVNEKLIFMRPWWGKIVGTDIIYDVENEKIIYAETITDGAQAYYQFKEGCPTYGCECIKKQ